MLTHLVWPADASRWRESLARQTRFDQFHRGPYVAALAMAKRARAEAVSFSGRMGTVFYPYLRRAIPGRDAALSDIESPYGYSGPLFSNDSPELVIEFRGEFHTFCENAGIVAEFVRLNPFLHPHAPEVKGQDETITTGTIQVVSLNDPEPVRWARVRKGHRQSITKSVERGVRVSVTTLDTCVAKFGHLYRDTMRRNQAGADYFFSNQFLASLQPAFGENLEAWVAERDGETLSIALVLKNRPWAHYFLSGTTLEGRRSFGNHQILWAAMNDLAANGYTIFNLGGAPEGDVPLSSFKQGFGAEPVESKTRRVVHLPGVFSRLCAERGVSAQLDRFFPPYRQTLRATQDA